MRATLSRASGARALCLLVAVGLAWPAGASAQAARRHARELEAGAASQQVALDPTPLRAGEGAVFVPSRSRPELEPQVRVMRGDTLVARGATGQRLVVPPGQYRVLVGQGPEGWRASSDVIVRAGETTVADGFFGSLRVTAVAPDGEPAAVQYTLVSADGYRVYGPADTSSEGDYGETRTWLLLPGSYQVIPGNRTRGRDGAVAVVVSADERARVRLLLGADGTVVGSEPGDYEAIATRRDWRLRWVVGGSGSLGRASGQLNGFQGDSVRLDLFTELGATYDRGPHLGRLELGLQQGWVGFARPFGRDLPFEKLDDSLRAEASYTYRLSGVVGPYARATLLTSLFPHTVTADRGYTLVTRESDGSETVEALLSGEELTLLEAFSPLITQEGAGLGITIWESRVFGAGFGAGVAARQTRYAGDARYFEERSGDEVRLIALEDASDWGPESNAWLRLQAGRWVALRAQVDAFVAVDALRSDAPLRPLFRASGSVSLRLSSWASLVYDAALHRDDAAIEALQFRHGLNLRLQYAIF